MDIPVVRRIAQVIDGRHENEGLLPATANLLASLGVSYVRDVFSAYARDLQHPRQEMRMFGMFGMFGLGMSILGFVGIIAIERAQDDGYPYMRNFLMVLGLCSLPQTISTLLRNINHDDTNLYVGIISALVVIGIVSAIYRRNA